jgi:prevent-host-death family protein
MRRGLEEPRISEVGVRELSRETSRIVRLAARGERLIVTRNGQPVAVILGMDDAIDWLVASADEFVRLRMAAREELARE